MSARSPEALCDISEPPLHVALAGPRLVSDLNNGLMLGHCPVSCHGTKSSRKESSQYANLPSQSAHFTGHRAAFHVPIFLPKVHTSLDTGQCSDMCPFPVSQMRTMCSLTTWRQFDGILVSVNYWNDNVENNIKCMVKPWDVSVGFLLNPGLFIFQHYIRSLSTEKVIAIIVAS